MSLPAASTTAVIALQSAVDASGSLDNATLTAINTVAAAAQAAVSAISSDLAANDASLTAGSPDGADPAVLVAWLQNMATQMGQQADLASAAGYAGRIEFNLKNGGA